MRERDHRFNSITRSFVAQYARQSTSIKSHSLPIGPVSVIAKELDRRFFKNIDNLASMKASDLAGLRLPSAGALLPGADERRVSETRNHLVVSRYLFKLALTNPGTSGVPLSDISSLCSIILAGTQAEVNHWFKRIKPGDYRNLPIRLASNPKRIFPYQFEVPGCMERFIQWRDQMHHAQQLHPLILATHIYIYFTHIHPFPYGNGTTGRSLMADYMIRQKYIPVVFLDLDRKEHVKSISDAQDGNPEDLCASVVDALGQMLLQFNLREHELIE